MAAENSCSCSVLSYGRYCDVRICVSLLVLDYSSIGYNCAVCAFDVARNKGCYGYMAFNEVNAC